MNILVVGVGQSLRGDDAAGLEAVKLWQLSHPERATQVHVEIIELPGLALLDLFKSYQAVILVDAVKTPASPGTIIHLSNAELESNTLQAGSAHGVGVAETLRLGCAVDPEFAQVQVKIIGIVGKEFKMGAGLSPEVRVVLEEAANHIELAINEFHSWTIN
jgi:hydrogenase maturation protease